MNEPKTQFKKVDSRDNGVEIEASRQDLTIFELLEPLGEHLAGQRFIGSAIVLVKGNMNTKQVEGTALTGHGGEDSLSLCVTLMIGVRDAIESMLERRDFSSPRTRNFFKMAFLDMTRSINEFAKQEKEANG